jgi:hypothetical protein
LPQAPSIERSEPVEVVTSARYDTSDFDVLTD